MKASFETDYHGPANESLAEPSPPRWDRKRSPARSATSPAGAVAHRRPSTLGDAISRRWWYLEADKLCAAARRRTGLQDFGEPAMEPALATLTESLEQEADLHPLGRFLMRVHLQGLLETRLRLVDLWHRESGEMLAPPVRRPIFITGMPRSGSTFLHELLAEDPANRAPRVWEVMFPIPPAVKSPQAPDPRIRKAAACLWWFRRFAPQADAVFPMRANTPHECVAIQSYSLLAEEFVSTCRVPRYERFLRHADLRPAYEWQRRFLQHLQHGAPERQWVLKSPDHVYGLEALLAVFPDARIVQTHRNPLDVLKSSCHLTEVLHRLYARAGDPAQLAARETAVLAGVVSRFVHFRDAHPELAARIIDVHYDEIVSDPLAVVRRIYDQFEMALGKEAGRRMESLAHQRSRYEHRRPAGTPDLIGGGKTEVTCFERYCARFNVGWGRSPAR